MILLIKLHLITIPSISIYHLWNLSAISRSLIVREIILHLIRVLTRRFIWINVN